jgi:hypothetical protein
MARKKTTRKATTRKTTTRKPDPVEPTTEGEESGSVATSAPHNVLSPVVALTGNETAAEQRELLDALRREFVELRGERSAVERRPRTHRESVEALKEWIAERSVEVELPFRYFASPGSGRTLTNIIPLATGGGVSPDGLTSLLCKLVPAEVEWWLASDMNAFDANADSISNADRVAELARIDTRTAEVEQLEETVCRALEDAAGTPISRRPDVDIAILLDVRESANGGVEHQGQDDSIEDDRNPASRQRGRILNTYVGDDADDNVREV